MPKKTRVPKGYSGKSTHNGSALSQIQEFYRFMLEQKLDTLEYDHQGMHVRLVRQHPATVPVPVPVTTHPAPAPYAGTASQDNNARATATQTSMPTLAPNAVTVKSPMMGIFYRASSPSSPPFVKTGDTVKKGQVLCLIEAMKVFNEVKADFDCVIVAIMLENGKPVKAGQDLYVVEKK